MTTRHKIGIALASMACILCCMTTAWAEDFNIMTDPLPPFNFEKNGKIQGITVDILTEIMAQAGNPIDPASIMMMPWARAYEQTLTQPGNILFSVAHTEERAPLFKWVGPIHSITLGLIGKRGLRLDSLAELHNYRVGSVKKSAPEQLLVKQGVSKAFLHRLASPILNIRKLAEGRIDFFAHVDMASAYLMEGEGIDPKKYRMVYPLKTLDLYIAFSKQTDDRLIAKLNQALVDLKKPGATGRSRYDEIIHAYIKSGGLSLAPKAPLAMAWLISQ